MKLVFLDALENLEGLEAFESLRSEQLAFLLDFEDYKGLIIKFQLDRQDLCQYHGFGIASTYSISDLCHLCKAVYRESSDEALPYTTNGETYQTLCISYHKGSLHLADLILLLSSKTKHSLSDWKIFAKLMTERICSKFRYPDFKLPQNQFEAPEKTLSFLINVQQLLVTDNVTAPLLPGLDDQHFKNIQSKNWFNDDEKILKPLLVMLQKEFNLNSVGIIQKAAPGYNNGYFMTSENETNISEDPLQEALEERMLMSDPKFESQQKTTGVYKIRKNSNSSETIFLPCRVGKAEEGIYGWLGLCLPTIEHSEKILNTSDNGQIKLITMIANQLGLYFSHFYLVRKKALRDRMQETIDIKTNFIKSMTKTIDILKELASFMKDMYGQNCGAIYSLPAGGGDLTKLVDLNKKFEPSVATEKLAANKEIYTAIKNGYIKQFDSEKINLPIKYIFPLLSASDERSATDSISMVIFASDQNKVLTKEEKEEFVPYLLEGIMPSLIVAQHFEEQLSAISGLEELFVKISEPEAMINEMINVIKKLLKVKTVSYMEVDSNKKFLVFKKGQGQSLEVLPNVTQNPIEDSIAGLVVKYCETLFIKNIADLNELHDNFPKERTENLKRLFSEDYATTYGTKSLLSVPLITGKGTDKITVKGVINVNNKENEKAFSEKDKQLLEALANLVATAIDKVNFLKEIDENREREILMKGAQEIQMSLMPKPSFFKNLPKEVDVFGESIAAKEVGGDLFEVVKLKDGRLLAIMGDVSGKGTPAAIIMGIAQTIVKTLAAESDNLVEILYKANKNLCEELEDMEGKFLTLQIVAVDLETGKCELSSAGHGPLIARLNESNIEIEPDSSMPLGLFDPPFKPYKTKSFTMKPGDVFVMFTDGLYEEMSPKGEMFGIERIRQIMENNSPKEAACITKALIEACQTWREGADAHDDLTVLSIKYKGKLNDQS